uniref:PUM-HD domain-containing protein n=1 Tax=Arcella intermedia TaxID=1963864 RepID=A0A6B2L9Y1_9EUKA
MQRCIDHGTLDQKLQLVEEIRKTALTLVQDAFGNYVVQYALDLDIPTLPTELIKQLHGKLHYLAKQKFSSNVVEKCLKSGDSECVLRVLRELMGENPDPKVTPRPLLPPESEIIQQKLVDLLQDSYGNYVIQTCLSEGATKVSADYLRMANLLRPYVHQLRTAPYIKRIHNLLNLPTSEPSSTDSISDVSPLSSPNRSQRPNLSLNLNLSTGLNRNPVLYFQNPSNQFSPICSPSISPSSSSSISQSESRSQSPKTNNNLLSLSSPIVSEKPPTPNPTKRSVSSDLFAPNFLSVPNSYPSSSIPKPRR